MGGTVGYAWALSLLREGKKTKLRLCIELRPKEKIELGGGNGKENLPFELCFVDVLLTDLTCELS